MNKIKLLALFGESGAGKNSIQNWLIKEVPNANKVISYTTRPQRDCEKNGQEYYFISISNFFDLYTKKKFLEYSVFNDWYYGTSINELEPDKINIGVFNPKGIGNLLQHLEKIDILPVWIKTDDKTRLLRSLNRETHPDCVEICRRFLTDTKDFANINFDYEIYLNNNIKDNYFDFLNKPRIVDFIKGQN